MLAEGNTSLTRFLRRQTERMAKKAMKQDNAMAEDCVSEYKKENILLCRRIARNETE